MAAALIEYYSLRRDGLAFHSATNFLERKMPVLIHPDVLDISVHNDVRDWRKVAAQGIRGIIHKASEGVGFVDREWTRRRADIQNAGMLVGAYHFMNAAPALQQAKHFLATTRPDGNMLIACDWEENGANTAPLATCKEFLRICYEETGQRPVLYSGSLLKAKGAGDPFLVQHRLWLAQYARAPQLPRGWDNYWLWQFSGDGFGGYGTYDGIPSNGIDSNVFGGEHLEAEWAGRPQDRSSPAVASIPVISTGDAAAPAPASPVAPPKTVTGGDTLADKLAMVNSQASLVNSLADQGSRIAQGIKDFKNFFWTLFGGGSAAAGVAKATIDPNKGTAAMAHDWLAQHAMLVIVLAVLTTVLVAYWYVRRIQRGLVSAANGGRYDPNKPEQ